MTRRLVKLSIAATLGLATVTTGALAVDDIIELDTLVLYSQGSADKYDGDAETRVAHLIETTNKIYEDSGLNFRLNAVKIQKYDMNDSATSGMVLGKIQKDENVHKIRDEVGADNVVIYRPYAGDGACGLGYQNNYLSQESALRWIDRYMYAHVSIDCGGYVTAHEVGHNSGLGHSEKQGSTGAYPYARGHGVQDTFTTVMAYSGVYNGTKVYKYSSPDLECKDGLPCGIAEGEDKEADAVKALKQTLPLLANFRDHIDQPDNNNSDDNNGTTEEGSQKVAAALKAYNDQKEVLKADRVKLKELKESFTKEKTAYALIVEEYKQKMDVHSLKKAKLNELKDSASRADYRAYYNNTYKPSALALKAYRNDVKNPAYAAVKEKLTAFKIYRNDTYKVNRAKLIELKKTYLDLKKVYG